MNPIKAIVKEMTPAAAKRTIWREGLAYRYRRYAGARRLVPCVDEEGKQWSKWTPIERTIHGIIKISKMHNDFRDLKNVKFINPFKKEGKSKSKENEHDHTEN